VSSERTCAECGKTYPLDPKHFHKSKDGYHSKCRHCRNAIAKKKRKRKTDKKLEEIEKGAVDLFIAAARLGGSNIPHSSELVEILYTYFGGVAGFGNAWMKQFYDAPAGGAFRTKMLETMVRLTAQNSADGGAKKPLTLWSEDELETELQKRVLEAATVINALPQKDLNDAVRNLQVVDRSQQGATNWVVPPVSPDANGERGQSVPNDNSGNDVR
jgi:hypothetical protein